MKHRYFIFLIVPISITLLFIHSTPSFSSENSLDTSGRTISSTRSASDRTKKTERFHPSVQQRSTDKTGLCCKNGVLDRKTMTKSECERKNGTLLLSPDAAESCGFCCNNGKISIINNKDEQKSCSQYGGHYFKSKSIADNNCGWCCAEGELESVTDKKKCTHGGGSFYTNQTTAKRKCTHSGGSFYTDQPTAKMKFKPATGFCNAKNRTISQVTENKCKGFKGVFYWKLSEAKAALSAEKLQLTKITNASSSEPEAQQSGDQHLYKTPKLEVKLLSGDFLKYGTHWKDVKPKQPLSFRWSHEVSGCNAVSYEVRNKTSGPDSPFILYGQVSHIPEKKKSSIFKVDFWSLVANNNNYPQTYSVKLTFSFVNFATKKVTRIASSNDVTVTIVKGPANQTLSLPVLRVSINKIEILDDSDDLSDGEFGFAFWLTYKNGGKTTFQIFSGSAGTDEDLSSNITLSLEDPPKYVTIRGYGYDDDELEWVPYGAFILLLAQDCGGFPVPGESSECPGDSATGHIQIDSGSSSGVEKTKQSFSFFAQGGSLKFKVNGSYELTQ